MLRHASGWTLIGRVLGLALIGFLQVTRGTAVRHVQGVGTDGSSIGVSEPEFPLMLAMLAGAAPRQLTYRRLTCRSCAIAAHRPDSFADRRLQIARSA